MKKQHRIVFISGGDVFQRDQTIQNLMQNRFGKEEVETHRFDANIAEHVSLAIGEVLSFSLFSVNKAIILQNVDQADNEEIKMLVNYIQHPRGDALFLLIMPEGKKPAAALQKALPKDAIIALEKTRPALLREMVQKRLAEQKVQIQKNALDYFMETCGHDIELALQELEKIQLWANEGQNISLENCRKLIQSNVEEEIWALTGAVAAKKSEIALRSLHHLMEQDQNELGMIALLTRLFRQMYHCKVLESERVPDAEWTKRVGLSGYPLKNTRDNSKRFRIQELQVGLTLLRQADEDLKGGKPGSPERLKAMIMERLILDLCRLSPNKAVSS